MYIHPWIERFVVERYRAKGKLSFSSIIRFTRVASSAVNDSIGTDLEVTFESRFQPFANEIVGYAV